MVTEQEIIEMLQRIQLDPVLRSEFAEVVKQCVRSDHSLQNEIHERVKRNLMDQLRRRGV